MNLYEREGKPSERRIVMASNREAARRLTESERAAREALDLLVAWQLVAAVSEVAR